MGPRATYRRREVGLWKVWVEIYIYSILDWGRGRHIDEEREKVGLWKVWVEITLFRTGAAGDISTKRERGDIYGAEWRS